MIDSIERDKKKFQTLGDFGMLKNKMNTFQSKDDQSFNQIQMKF